MNACLVPEGVLYLNLFGAFEGGSVPRQRQAPLDRLTNINIRTLYADLRTQHKVYEEQKKNGLKAWPLFEFNTATVCIVSSNR